MIYSTDGSVEAFAEGEVVKRVVLQAGGGMSGRTNQKTRVALEPNTLDDPHEHKEEKWGRRGPQP